MTQFKKYPKLHHLHKEEVQGILDGNCVIQEKIDGANTSIWYREDNSLGMGTRTRDISDNDESFNGFCDYVRSHEGINKLLSNNTHYTLYGEWLVKHTINYRPTSFRHFYLFDIMDNNTGEFLDPELTATIADDYDINRPSVFAVIHKPTLEQIKEFAGQSSIGDVGEGVVIKNTEFVNQFGDHHYAKFVTQDFCEKNANVFGGNNKFSETYWEQYIVNKYMTLPRVRKVIQKIACEKRLDLSDTPRVMNSCYHDMLTEEIWDIASKVKEIKFDKLKKIAYNKSKQIFHDLLLNNEVSVADK